MSGDKFPAGCYQVAGVAENGAGMPMAVLLHPSNGNTPDELLAVGIEADQLALVSLPGIVTTDFA